MNRTKIGVAAMAAVVLLAGCSAADTRGEPDRTTMAENAAVGVDETAPMSPSSASETAEQTGTPATVDETPWETPALPDGAFQVTDARGKLVTVFSTERIVPLDGDVAEILFALGAGDRVVAVDLSATYPPDVGTLPRVGYQRALSAEPIVRFEPTLLIATEIAGPPEVLDELERLGIPLVIVPSPATRNGAAEKIRAVADAIDMGEEGNALADEVQTQIDDALALAPTRPVPPNVAVLYVRGQMAQRILGTDFSPSWVIDAAGGVNIADTLGIADSADITAEAFLESAPDVIVIPEAGLESVGGVDGLLEAIPVIAETPAGRNRAILAYEDQLMLGNGPRTGQFVAQVIADLTVVIDQSSPLQPQLENKENED